MQCCLILYNVQGFIKHGFNQINPSKYCLWRIKSPFAFHLVFSSDKLTRHGYFLQQTYIFLTKANATRKRNTCGFGMWKYMILRSYIWDCTKMFSYLHLLNLANKHGDISPWNKKVNALYRYKLFVFNWITYYRTFFFVRVMK